ncbi:squalene/phytoene synthase family protein [Stakelama saccharophila]|uniref:Squalene/phytoene synthase family protein n=1 Tax=Stakelama saccharophila TaxID=3075605 RepID=A0ABZ0BD93_9SPHN|nr:squalene/phytoene synthase family protein [Stakelama sp. W311]WNO55051.1 squalene/phytoene synthase family protein [Stakelama sp. W311]
MTASATAELIENPEFALALSYVPPAAQSGVAALFALDGKLAEVVRTTTEPALGQMRLLWWRDTVLDLKSGRVAAVPAVENIHRYALPQGADVQTDLVAGIADGWSVLIEEETLGRDALMRFARLRGGNLFGSAAALCSVEDDGRLRKCGQGWALVDLARHSRSSALADACLEIARPLLRYGLRGRLPRAARGLGALAHLAERDSRRPPSDPVQVGAPGRVGRMLWHRLTGM